MKQNRAYLLLPLAALLALSACSKEDALPSVSVDPAFQPYFSAFEAAAAERGIAVDLAAETIGAVFSADLEEPMAGKCTSFSSGVRIIYIDEQSWQQRSELEREFLLFHELGHCYLARGHLDEADANGFCVSIMQSGSGQCRSSYRNATRDLLLDELFGQ